MMTATAPNCIPTTHVCRACGSLFTCYGDNDGLCPRLACSVPSRRHADLDTPQPCWVPSCTVLARYVVEWFDTDARRETCCMGHFDTTFEYATQTSDGFTNPQVELVPLADRLKVAA
jgi:hypothetical protein